MDSWGSRFPHLFALNNKKLHLAPNISAVLSSQNSSFSQMKNGESWKCHCVINFPTQACLILKTTTGLECKSKRSGLQPKTSAVIMRNVEFKHLGLTWKHRLCLRRVPVG